MEQLKLNFRNQVLDPRRPGVGERAREIDRLIRRELPQMTTLAYPRLSASMTDLDQYVREYTELVDDNFRKTVPEELQQYYDLSKDMAESLVFFKEQTADFQSARGVESARAVTLIENMHSKTNEYRSQINAILSDPPEWVPPKIINAEGAQIGEIVQTFQSVFSNQGDYGVAVWSLVLSLFIDLIPFIYAVTLVRPIDANIDGDVGTL